MTVNQDYQDRLNRHFEGNPAAAGAAADHYANGHGQPAADASPWTTSPVDDEQTGVVDRSLFMPPQPDAGGQPAAAVAARHQPGPGETTGPQPAAAPGVQYGTQHAPGQYDQRYAQGYEQQGRSPADNSRSYSGPPAAAQQAVGEPAGYAQRRENFWSGPQQHVAAPAAVSGPQPQAQQYGADEYGGYHYGQQQAGLPEWLQEPAESKQYVDERVGSDDASLTSGADRLDLVGSAKLAPGRGWRKWLYYLTFKSWNLGLSPAEVADTEMIARIRQPIHGDYKVGVMSLKGGVGKTTTTVTLGSTFAELRKGDRVVGLDGNPDFGNLVSRVPRQTNTTVKDLLADGELERYGEVRQHTSQNIHGLEVVAGERDLTQSEQFSKVDYERVMAVLERHYSLIFTDCGTGQINEVMAGVLDTAHALILVSSMTVDGARAVSANIEWLRLHGFQHLVERAVVILNTNKQGRSSANVEQLQEHFGPHVRAVHVIPFDEHLAEGDVVNLTLLHKKTRRAFEELAELIAADFPNATGKHTRER